MISENIPVLDGYSRVYYIPRAAFQTWWNTGKAIVTVSQEHIAGGRRHAPCACPVYLALKAAGLPVFSVGPMRASLFSAQGGTSRDSAILAPLPGEVTEFISAFDTGYKVTPFTFELELSREDLQRMVPAEAIS